MSRIRSIREMRKKNPQRPYQKLGIMKKFLLAILVLLITAAGFIFWLFERAKDGVPILRAEKLFVIDEPKEKNGEAASEEENA